VARRKVARRKVARKVARRKVARKVARRKVARKVARRKVARRKISKQIAGQGELSILTPASISPAAGAAALNSEDASNGS
jgi:hypothetical protein